MRKTGLALLMTSVLCPALADAGERLAITTTECAWLESAELRRLTALEFASAASTAPELHLEYLCADKDVTIRLSNKETGARVERVVTAACCDKVEAERSLALLSIGLYRAGHSVLTPSTPPPPDNELPKESKSPSSTPPAKAPTPKAKPPQNPPTPKAKPPVAAPPATTTPPRGATAKVRGPDTVTERPSFLHQIGIVGRTRVHNPASNAVVTSGAGLRYDAWPWKPLSFGANAGATFGSTERSGGEVKLRALSLGASAGWRPLETKRFGITTSLGAGISHVTIEGASNDEDIGSASVSGVTAYTRLVITPSLRAGHFEFGLPLEVGYLFRAPRGEVLDDDESPVQLDGIAAGLGLAVSFGWSPRSHTRQTANSPRSRR